MEKFFFRRKNFVLSLGWNYWVKKSRFLRHKLEKECDREILGSDEKQLFIKIAQKIVSENKK
jgi:hypothetical protein